MTRLRRGALAALLGHALIGHDEPSRRPPWPLGLPVAERGAPPFVEAACEAKHLDVVQMDGSVIYLTWSGEVIATAEAAVVRFLAAVAAARTRPECQPAIASAAVVRFIGFTDPDRAQALAALIAQSFARSGWRVAHRLVFDGSHWRGFA
ncbi:MAG TPA: hypothetical protein VEL07_02895 [Planctomycetota bacterium]|nr:hypothetical protein [Planctomycetota bacterium]